MFKTIVVGCDGSRGSLAAIELAARLRDPEGGRLVLTSVYPHYLTVPDFYPVGAEGRAEADAQEILLLSARRVPEGVPHETMAEARASIAAGLNDVAERTGADLIVLGPTHRHSLGRMMGRMTVQRLLHGAPCAVAVAGGEPSGGKLLVAFDGSPEAGIALKTAYELAELMGAPVELLAVIEPVTYMGPYVAAVDPELEQRMIERVEARLASAGETAPAGVTVTSRVAWGSPTEEVLAATTEDVRMVVAGSRGYGSLHRAMAGSVSGALLTQSRVPVLVTPRAAEAAREVA